ncbi:hypothetical protein ACFXAF_12385 [Kitasatospora sp. NPDC059463]|uniref:hypothetical protein n=1 Tax=unclassified Kitasatospora TaxID=2633591 RepID=UPI0036A0D6AF
MDLWDWLALAGLALLGAGLALLAPWLGLAVTGALLATAGIVGGTHAERAAQRDQRATGGRRWD